MMAQELREKTLDELQEELSNSYKEQFSLRMQKATNQLGDSSQLRKVRRNIARIKTIVNQKKKI